jgi:hypothetical protein
VNPSHASVYDSNQIKLDFICLQIKFNVIELDDN